MLIALAAAAAPLAAQEPATLHPSDSVIVLQMADVQALISAYPTTAMARMLSDSELHEAIGSVVAADGPPLDPLALAMMEYDGAVESGQMPPIFDLLSGIASVSYSTSVDGGDLFAFIEAADDAQDEAEYIATHLGSRLVVDFVDEPAAEEVFGFLATFLEEESPSNVQVRTRAITAPGGGGGFGTDKLTVRSFAPASPDANLDPFTPTVRIVSGGRRLAVLFGNAELDASLQQMVAPSPDTSAAALFLDGRRRFGDGNGLALMELYMSPFVERAVAMQAPQALPALDLAEGLFGPFASMFIRGGHWRIGLEDGQFVTQGLHSPGAAGPMTGMIGSRPLDQAALSLAHPDALVTSVTSLDPDVLSRTIEMLASEQGEGALEQLEQAYGFRPERDIAGSLGGAISYSLPSLKSLLAAPNLMGAAALDDREGFIRGMDGLFAMAEDMGGDVQVQRSEYRGSMVYTLSFTGALGSLPLGDLPIDPANFFRPTITVMEDRVLITTLPTHAKKEIRRVAKAKKKDEAPGIHEGIVAMGVPEGATTVGYADWPSFFGNLYTQLKSLAPMAAGMAGGELPFNVEALPDAALLTRHFRPSMRWVSRGDGHVQHYAKSSIGPETLLLPAMGVGVAMPRAMAGSAMSDDAWVEAELVEEVPTSTDAELASARTQETLVEIAVAIRLFELDHQGAAPESLTALLQKTPAYPGGYLEGGSVPQDAWGQAFVYALSDSGYTLWSIGANGIDDGGAGDDLTVD
ncbi:MAG: type II secretion system protein GspG [Planctomycetota bacterium]